MEKGFVVVMVMILGFISVVTAVPVPGTARYYKRPYVRKYESLYGVWRTRIASYPRPDGNLSVHGSVGPPGSSACFGFEDQGVLIAGATDAIYQNKAACGKYYSVKCTGPADQVLKPCTGKSVIVKIVDYCPAPGCDETFNLSEDAFSIIANPTASKIKIEYELVVAMIKME